MGNHQVFVATRQVTVQNPSPQPPARGQGVTESAACASKAISRAVGGLNGYPGNSPVYGTTAPGLLADRVGGAGLPELCQSWNYLNSIYILQLPLSFIQNPVVVDIVFGSNPDAALVLIILIP